MAFTRFLNFANEVKFNLTGHKNKRVPEKKGERNRNVNGNHKLVNKEYECKPVASKTPRRRNAPNKLIGRLLKNDKSGRIKSHDTLTYKYKLLQFPNAMKR